MAGQLTRRGLLGLAVALALPACASLGASRPRRVLVAGATGGTGRAVVQALQREGIGVRVLVRDVAAARAVLGDGPQYAAGNVLDPASLAAALAGVDAVVSCIGARAPDGPDRPEKVDYEGVRNLATAAATASCWSRATGRWPPPSSPGPTWRPPASRRCGSRPPATAPSSC